MVARVGLAESVASPGFILVAIILSSVSDTGCEKLEGKLTVPVRVVNAMPVAAVVVALSG